MFLEDQNSFQREPLPIPSGVPYDYVTTKNMSIEGRCIVGNVHKYSSGITTALMWTLDPQSGSVTATILPTICSTSSGNIPYDCAVIGNRYVVVGRTCPESPYATIWENGNKVFESNFNTCFGILHSISSNEVISGAACFSAVIWNRGQGANPIIDNTTGSRYHSVISEDGSVVAFHNTDIWGGNITDVWKDGRKVVVYDFFPTAVVMRSNNLAVVYGKNTFTQRASRFTVDFSQQQPVVSQKEDLNSVFSSIIPQGVILESIEDVSTDERFILCSAKLLSNNLVTPCIISLQHVTYTVTVNSTGNGSGSISSSPTGISYSYPSNNTGSSTFNHGSTVVITATANPGQR
ncbi:MAG: hypothetical protein ABDH29_04120 [Aquificaceae bacterium]